MTDQDDDDIFESDTFIAWAASHFEEDVHLAAASDLPVLITGSPAACRQVAYEVDRQSGSSHGAIEVIDCRQQGAVDALRFLARRTATPPGDRPRILLLEEVHALGAADQELLASRLEEVQLSRNPPVRILSSSSIPLFEQVAHHAFDESLYYRLNAIQVVVPSNRDGASPGGETLPV